jgi:predicted nucleotidyltransferase
MGRLRRYEERLKERRSLLDVSLERFLDVCRTKSDVLEVYAFGSFARGAIGPTSDLDLLVVRRTEIPYHDRGDDLRRDSRLAVRVDLVVVTPEEFTSSLPSNSFGRSILASARRVYAA